MILDYFDYNAKLSILLCSMCKRKEKKAFNSREGDFVTEYWWYKTIRPVQTEWMYTVELSVIQKYLSLFVKLCENLPQLDWPSNGKNWKGKWCFNLRNFNLTWILNQSVFYKV